MNHQVEWIAFVTNLLLRITLTIWDLPRARLPIPDEFRDEAYEQFQAHNARQIATTWPLLALVGLFAAVARTSTPLNAGATLIVVLAHIFVGGAVLLIPHDYFRPKAIAFIVVAFATIADFALALKGWTRLASFLAEPTIQGALHPQKCLTQNWS